MDIRSKIVASIERNRRELVETCSELIQIDTQNPPGDCSKVVSFLQEKYKKIRGPDFFRVSAPRHTLKDLEYPRDNFVARLGKEKRKIGLCIGTHMDVVPPGPLGKWRYPPFSGKVAAGKIWGRGAVDAKCSLAAQLYAMMALVESGAELGHSLLCIGTVDDEAPGDKTWTGMEYVAGDGLRKLGLGFPEYAINAEASGLEEIWGNFPGSLTLKFKFKGKPGHPPMGVNALEKAISFWNEILARGRISFEKSPRLVFLNGGSDLDFGLTPVYAELIVRIPISPRGRNTPERTFALVRKAIAQRREASSLEVEVLSSQRAYDVGEENALVVAIKKSVEFTHRKVKYGGGIVGSGDLFHFFERNIPGVTFGAGNLERCHAPNEYVSMKELVNQAKIYALTAYELCNSK